MKSQYSLLTLLAVAALATGCGPSEKPATEDREATAKQLEKIRTETKEAAQDIKQYAYAQKAEFVADMQTRMAQIKGDLDQLSAKVEKSTDAVKAEAEPKVRALRDQMAGLSKQLDEARNSSESTWANVQARSKKAYDELKDKFRQARQWLSDKLAP